MAALHNAAFSFSRFTSKERMDRAGVWDGLGWEAKNNKETREK